VNHVGAGAPTRPAGHSPATLIKPTAKPFSTRKHNTV